MYKDKDKQREANAERQRRYKAKQKALLSEGVTDKALPEPEAFGHIFHPSYGITWKEGFRVVTGKPGDADYNGVCTETWRAERGR